MLNIPITPPRVPLIDARTGLIERSWYMFFLSLNNVAVSVVSDDVGPSTVSLLATYDAALQALAQNVSIAPLPVDLSSDLIARIEGAGLGDYSATLVSQVMELQKQIDGLLASPLSAPTTINGYPINIGSPSNYDALMFLNSAWTNIPQTEITDGGNF